MSEILLPRRELADALKACSTVIEKAVVPVLNNICVSVQRGAATLACTDTTLRLSTTVPAEHDTITATTLPAIQFRDAADRFEGQSLKIALADGFASLSSGRARIRIPTLPSDQFPPAPAAAEAACFSVPCADLAEALAAASYAGPDGIGTKYAVAVFCYARNGDFGIATTDGTRGARAETPIKSDADVEPFGLPHKAARLLAQLASAGEGDATFKVGERTVCIEIGAWCLTTQLVVGALPRLDSVLDDRFGEPMMFDPRELARCLGRLSIIADKRSRGVRFELSPDKLALSLASQSGAEASEELPVEYEGEPYSGGFSLDFLRAAIDRTPGDDALLWMTRTNNCAVIETRAESPSHFIGPYRI